MKQLSKTEQQRLEAMFKHAFGRDLTPEERRFLNLARIWDDEEGEPREETQVKGGAA